MTYPTQPTASHFVNGAYLEDAGLKAVYGTKTKAAEEAIKLQEEDAKA